MHESEYYGLVTPKGDWWIEPYCHQIFKEGDVYHGTNFWIGDTLPHLPEIYNSVTLNVYVDKGGKELFVEMAHDFDSFNAVDTLAWFRKGTNYRIRGKSGALLKTFQYDETNEFVGINNNRLIYRRKTTDDWDYDYTYTGYSIDGEEQFQFTCPEDLEEIIELSPGFFAIRSENIYNWGFKNADGEDYLFEYTSDEITYLYQEPDIYSMDYFPVVRPYGHGFGREMGLIDRTGREVIPIIYRYVDEPVQDVAFRLSHEENGLGQFSATSRQMIVNKFLRSNDLLEPFRTYGKPIGFYDGLIPLSADAIDHIDTLDNGELAYWASDKQYYYYVNTELERTITLDTSYMFAGLFSEGLAPVVNTEKELGFINKKGEVVIAPAYALSVAGEYPIPYLVIPEFKGGFAYIKAFKGYIDKKGKAFFAGERLYDRYDFSH
ncbi:MAG: WG repeat-containing protein [Bacteroidota bacterium]